MSLGYNMTYSISLNTNGLPGTLTICNDYLGNNTTIQNNPANLTNVTLTDINAGKNYLGSVNTTQAKVNFSNLQLPSDNTGVGTVLTGGNGGTYIETTTLNGAGQTATDYTPGNGQNGPPGFVMVFYKVNLIQKPYGTYGIQTNYNPLNNFLPKNNYNYFTNHRPPLLVPLEVFSLPRPPVSKVSVRYACTPIVLVV